MKSRAIKSIFDIFVCLNFVYGALFMRNCPFASLNVLRFIEYFWNASYWSQNRFPSLFFFSIIFDRNVKIANKDCLFYSLSTDCGKINDFEMYR